MQEKKDYNTHLTDISVTILSCNRREELRRTLLSLHQSDLPWKEIIIADNVSTDGTPSMIEREFPAVQLIRMHENNGVQGINRAFAEATGKWVLSLDDDSAPEVATWPALLKALPAHEDAAAIGLSIVAESARSRAAEGQHSIPNSAQPAVQPAYGFSQAGCLFNQQALKALGGFDERLFLWSVELHWTAKALTQGWKLYGCSAAQVVHRSTPLNRSSRRHAFYYCRNLFLFLLLYAPRPLLLANVRAFINNACKYSVLHSTFAYMQAIRQAQHMFRHYPSTRRLSHSQFTSIQPDLRAPFSYLG